MRTPLRDAPMLWPRRRSGQRVAASCGAHRCRASSRSAARSSASGASSTRGSLSRSAGRAAPGGVRGGRDAGTGPPRGRAGAARGRRAGRRAGGRPSSAGGRGSGGGGRCGGAPRGARRRRPRGARSSRRRSRSSPPATRLPRPRRPGLSLARPVERHVDRPVRPRRARRRRRPRTSSRPAGARRPGSGPGGRRALRANTTRPEASRSIRWTTQRAPRAPPPAVAGGRRREGRPARRSPAPRTACSPRRGRRRRGPARGAGRSRSWRAANAITRSARPRATAADVALVSGLQRGRCGSRGSGSWRRRESSRRAGAAARPYFAWSRPTNATTDWIFSSTFSLVDLRAPGRRRPRPACRARRGPRPARGRRRSGPPSRTGTRRRSAVASRVRSGGTERRLPASGPSPLPFSPWQTAQ